MEIEDEEAIILLDSLKLNSTLTELTLVEKTQESIRHNHIGDAIHQQIISILSMDPHQRRAHVLEERFRSDV